ncbi:HK97-gp10 family putative phage morphogenesis protein [Psychrobacillus sp. BM2]|uniref:HK97-gp10 family putative phage morphogenesis protein n=1 Tax=Psychrobacillus sp. BM2 TaxID=3400421 RepID=UPI003B022625
MELQLTGLEETLRNLSNLNISETVENRALTKAGKVTQETIIAEANFGNRSDGVIKKNIKLKRPKDGQVVIHTGKAYHSHILEFGRSAGSTITKGGKKVTWGKINPNPFFSRGYEQSKSESMNAIIEEIQGALGL